MKILPYLSLLLSVVPITSVKAQITYIIDGFSDQYYAREYISETNRAINPSYASGWIAVFDKRDDDTLLKVDVKRLNGFIEKGPTQGNDVPLPYKKQEAVFYEDINFDGKKDFAIKDWTHQTDHYLNYQIFLADKAGIFTYNKDFSKLTRGERGMFEIKKEQQRLILHKGPYYYSSFKEVYAVQNNKPLLMSSDKRMNPTPNDPFVVETKADREAPDSPLRRADATYLYAKDKKIDTLLFFTIPKRQKQVLLFAYDNRLVYVLEKSDSSIEFDYGRSENQYFTYDPDSNKKILRFQKGVYALYETEAGVGIDIHSGGKTYHWKGDKTTQKGRLMACLHAETKNVHYISNFKVDMPNSPYYGKVFVEDKADKDYLSGAGWVGIYNKQDDKELIKVESPNLFVSLHKGQVKANVQKLPYGEQSVIIYEDFNFDGKKDLAVSDGNNSCYGGPSYQIYLADGKGFTHSESFTQLAQEYCGMFRVDAEKKTLSTMTKSGCCWHQYTTYKVKNDKPYPVKIVEEDASGSGLTVNYTVSERKNGTMVEQHYQRLNTAIFTNGDGTYADNLMTIYTFKNGKKMYLFYDQDWEKAYYVFTNAEGKIELLYDGEIRQNAKEYCAEFENKGVTYKIYQDRLEVIVNGKTHILKPVNKVRGIGAFLG